MRTFLILFDIFIDIALFFFGFLIGVFSADQEVNWLIIIGLLAPAAISITATYFGIKRYPLLLWAPVTIALFIFVLFYRQSKVEQSILDEWVAEYNQQKELIDSLSRDFLCDKTDQYDENQSFLSIDNQSLKDYTWHESDVSKYSNQVLSNGEVLGKINNKNELILTKEGEVRSGDGHQNSNLIRRCKNKDNKTAFDLYVVKDISGKVVK